jgi:hypothetical protein
LNYSQDNEKILEERVKTIETQLKSMAEQIRIINNEIIRINQRNFLEEIIVIENGKKERKSIREMLVDNYKLLEPIRLIYDISQFLSRHKFIRIIFIMVNIVMGTSILGFTLTGKGLLEIIGLLK